MGKACPMAMHDMFTLAASGIAKVDLLGLEGTEQCTRDEVLAMALLAVTSGALPSAAERLSVSVKPVFKSVRNVK